jgi:hypothetical protein
MPRLLRWFPVAWAAGVYVVLLRLPVYTQMSDTMDANGSETLSTSHATLAAVNGPRVYLLLAVPVLASALAALPWPPKLRQPADIIGTVIASAFVVLSLPSVGMFFIPSAVALFGLVAEATRASPPAA